MIRDYQDRYGEWRQERGITPHKVARVAIKWLDKKKAAATSQ
jgi:hypothetical protein